MTPEQIIPDDEIGRVHGHANFGSMDKRQVVDETVLKYAFGYSTGHTAECIVIEHRLASKPRGRSDTPRLTKKGMQYLRAVYGHAFKDIKSRRLADAT